jgi:hypothetical protein
VLVEQTYPGREDHERHFEVVREAFADERYLTVDGKPLFFLYRPRRIPDHLAFTDLWRELAHRAGFKGIFFVGSIEPEEDPRKLGLDGGVDHGALRHQPSWLQARDRVERALKGRTLWYLHQRIGRFERPTGRLRHPHDKLTQLFNLPAIVDYAEATRLDYLGARLPDWRFPCTMPNWDNTPRLGRWGFVLRDSTPERWYEHLAGAIRLLRDRPLERRLVFVKSWNEWAEGNYLEPDGAWGRGFLEATRRAVTC